MFVLHLKFLVAAPVLLQHDTHNPDSQTLLTGNELSHGVDSPRLVACQLVLAQFH